jgi:hypothetical protein
MAKTEWSERKEIDMKKSWMVLLVFGLLVSLSSSLYGAPIDFVPPGLQKKIKKKDLPPGLRKKDLATDLYLDVMIDGKSYDPGSIMLLPNGKVLFPSKKIVVGDQKNPDFEVEYQMVGDVDPFISYTFSAINYTEEEISFATTGSIFLDPVVEGPNTVYASLGGSVMDFGGFGASITPASTATDSDYDGILELQTAFVSDGSGWTNLGIDVGTDFFREGVVGSSYGPYETGEVMGPIGEWTELGYSLDFILSPSSSVAFSGYIGIESDPDNVMANPIPPTAYLFATGLLGLVSLRRRLR